jgi:hypothetical protein
MKFSIALRSDPFSNKKISFIYPLIQELTTRLALKDLGSDLMEYSIGFDVCHLPSGFEKFKKNFKPKFTEYKSVKNKQTGQQIEIIKLFDYSISFDDDKYNKFISISDEESEKMLVAEIVNSLSNLDKLPAKVIDFDRELFKKEVIKFFTEKGFIKLPPKNRTGV